MLNFSNPLTIAALVAAALVLVYFIKPKQSKAETEDENIKEEQVAVSKVEKAESEDELEIVAAIMGALSAYLEVPASKLRIKSIKRVDGTSSTWRRESMKEI